MRRFIKTTHVSHDERNKIAGHYTVALEVQILTDSIIKNRDSTDAFEGGASVLNAGRAGSSPHESWPHSSLPKARY